MADNDKGPLSAAELEREEKALGQPALPSQDDNDAARPDGEHGPNPIAGTMLPPD